MQNKHKIKYYENYSAKISNRLQGITFFFTFICFGILKRLISNYYCFAMKRIFLKLAGSLTIGCAHSRNSKAEGGSIWNGGGY
jgi:hypothetical protein